MNATSWLLLGLLVLVVAFFFWPSRSPAPDDAATATPQRASRSRSAWLLMRRDGELVALRCKRNDKAGGVVLNGVLLPAEMVLPLPHNGFVLADAAVLPADLSVGPDVELHQLVRVSQLAWVAQWTDFYKALRRQNLAAIFATNDATQTLKNAGSGLLVLMVLWMALNQSGINAAVTRLTEQNVVLSGQLSRLQGQPVSANVPASLVSTPVPTPKAK